MNTIYKNEEYMAHIVPIIDPLTNKIEKYKAEILKKHISHEGEDSWESWTTIHWQYGRVSFESIQKLTDWINIKWEEIKEKLDKEEKEKEIEEALRAERDVIREVNTHIVELK